MTANSKQTKMSLLKSSFYKYNDCKALEGHSLTRALKNNRFL